MNTLDKALREILEENFSNGLGWAENEGALKPEEIDPIYLNAIAQIKAAFKRAGGIE